MARKAKKRKSMKEDVMSINKVMISGNLTRDPELRETSSGMAVLKFGVAVNDRRRNQQTGEWEDYPNFINCSMFGKRAEALHPYLTKGQKVAIDGRLRYSSWENEGQKRSKLEVIINDLELLGGAKQKEQAQVQNTTEQTFDINDCPF